MGVIEDVGSIEELSILKSQSSLRIFTDITQLSSSDQLSVTLNSTNYTFNISSVFDDLDTTNDLAEILNNGAIVSNSSLNSFRDLGLHAVASGSSFVISSSESPCASAAFKISS